MIRSDTTPLFRSIICSLPHSFPSCSPATLTPTLHTLRTYLRTDSLQSTANLDHDSDVAVQKAIRDELGEGGSGATILCIAHRLHTIIDFDRVLVLSQGEVLEYDTPANLLRRDGGGGGAGGAGTSEFWKLCSESGDLQGLKEIAFAHEKQQAERRM